MISHPVYVKQSLHYIYDIVPTMYDITTLCADYTTLGIYGWHHLCYRRGHISSISSSHNLYDFTSTSGITSHTCIRHRTSCIFVITTSPLILQPLLYDITPTICLTSYALYITSYLMLISSHYCTFDSTTLAYDTTSSMQFKIYTICVTWQSQICVITPTVLRASHPLFVWHHTRYRYSIFSTMEDITSSLYEIKPPVLWHHTHYILNRINAIFVPTSTLLMISQQVYFWDLFLYICRHHIHRIQQPVDYICTITATGRGSHTHSFHYITTFEKWHCTHYMFIIRYTI